MPKTLKHLLLTLSLATALLPTQTPAARKFLGALQKEVGAGLKKVEQKLPKLAKQSLNKLSTEKSVINHIFSEKPLKLADTPENRKIIENLVNNSKYYLGKDIHGKEWYAKTLRSGKQIYSYVRDGIIKGAGRNDTVKDLVKLKNLKK